MAKFLDTQAISSELMKLIKDAKEKIVLVAYSFQVNPQLKERISTKSKTGTLSEIVFVIGNKEFNEVDKQWMTEIQDLKVIKKLDLHAKCYLNEERAIIGSMNLYEYSQQRNIEMGILITKAEDPQAYADLIDEINHIKVNGTRLKISDLSTEKEVSEIPKTKGESKPTIVSQPVRTQFTDFQKLQRALLEQFRFWKSRDDKTSEKNVLSDEEIIRMVLHPKVDKTSIYDLIEKKNAIKYGIEIIERLAEAEKYTIGQVTNIFYQVEDSKYDRVKLKVNGEEKWYDTAKELPQKNRTVAVKINKIWFNDYFYLD